MKTRHLDTEIETEVLEMILGAKEALKELTPERRREALRWLLTTEDQIDKAINEILS